LRLPRRDPGDGAVPPRPQRPQRHPERGLRLQPQLGIRRARARAHGLLPGRVRGRGRRPRCVDTATTGRSFAVTAGHRAGYALLAFAAVLFAVAAIAGWHGAERITAREDQARAVEQAAAEFVRAYGTFEHTAPSAYTAR